MDSGSTDIDPVLVSGLLSGESMRELARLPLEKLVVRLGEFEARWHMSLTSCSAVTRAAIGLEHYLPNRAHQASQWQARGDGYLAGAGRVDQAGEF